MNKATRLLLPLAAAALPVAFMAPAASAEEGWQFSATLNPLNQSTGSGMVTITGTGNTADVHVTWSGLAETFNDAPFPHVQHIHIGAKGECPTPAADKDGDGVVSTTEGAPSYGGVGTTLSTKGDTSPAATTDINIAPAGSSTDYRRTIQLSQETLDSLVDGTAVVVVHGLDPATLSKKAQEAKSDLVPSLPLAATSPALCGALGTMPAGGVETGSGSTSGTENAGLIGLGGALLAAGGAGMIASRRRATSRA